jgi:hypothetical protein
MPNKLNWGFDEYYDNRKGYYKSVDFYPLEVYVHIHPRSPKCTWSIMIMGDCDYDQTLIERVFKVDPKDKNDIENYLNIVETNVKEFFMGYVKKFD